MPAVSVIVPTHNRPELLAEALASVRAQTFTDYEIIVVSNGEPIPMQIASERTALASGARYFELRTGNISVARNFAVMLAKAEWLAFLDDDDLWLPRKLERQIRAADLTGADMIVCDSIEFHPDGREILREKRRPAGWSYHKALCHQKWIALPSTVLIRKSAFDSVGGFDPAMRVCEDGDLWRRIAWQHDIMELEEPLARYRRHPGAVSEDRREIHRYDLRHSLKMLRDTPDGLRDAVPSFLTLMRKLILRNLTPWFLRHPRKAIMASLTPLRP